MNPLQIRSIQEEKGTQHFPIEYICDFEKRWNETINRLKKSKVNLANINIACGMNKKKDGAE